MKPLDDALDDHIDLGHIANRSSWAGDDSDTTGINHRLWIERYNLHLGLRP